MQPVCATKEGLFLNSMFKKASRAGPLRCWGALGHLMMESHTYWSVKLENSS